MFETMIIALREGLEATLAIGLFLVYRSIKWLKVLVYLGYWLIVGTYLVNTYWKREMLRGE